MNATISNTLLLNEAKQRVKQDIIGRFKFALDKKCDYIRDMREDAGRLQKYAESYATLERLYKAFKRLNDDKEFARFRAHFFNADSIEILEISGVDRRCLTDVEFYLRLIDDELDKSITVKPVLARVNNNAVEVKIKVCIGGYCYESDRSLEDTSNSSVDNNNVTANGSHTAFFNYHKVDGKNGRSQ